MTVLHTHVFGDPAGEPVLAIHGVMGHGRRYRRLADEALPTRRTISVDLRGHGRSTSDGPWSVPQHVADLLDTLDAHDIHQPVDVIGHSYGGAIALALLAAAPQRLRRLVLLDPALARPAAGASQAALDVIDHPGWSTVEEATIARHAGLQHPAVPGAFHPDVVEDVAEHLVEGADGRFRFRFHRPAVITAWGEMCAALPTELPAVPTLVVAADRADMVTPEIEAQLGALLGDQLQVVHIDSGHMVYWDRFDDTAAAVTAFLA